MKIKAKVKPGYGAASGKSKDSRYPKGTLKAQYEHFLKRGLDLNKYFSGTINIDITPYTYKILKPKYFFENIDWSKFIPPENFYFFDVSLHFKENIYHGLIYMPDPATKKDHIQDPKTLELILPKIEDLEYGDPVYIEVNNDQLKILNNKGGF